MSSVRRNLTSQKALSKIGDSEHEKAKEQSRKNERELCSSFHVRQVRSIILRSCPAVTIMDDITTTNGDPIRQDGLQGQVLAIS